MVSPIPSPSGPPSLGESRPSIPDEQQNPLPAPAAGWPVGVFFAVTPSFQRSQNRGTMKVGIVVPYSWSYWGAVPEHAELQAASLERQGIETRTVMGNDPPGSFTRVLHPRHGRHGEPPADVIPVGRSVIVPANGALPNIVLSPRAIVRMKQVLERERFDVLHLHEPMTPVICTAAMAWARCPVVATFHASGGLGWLHAGRAGLGLPDGSDRPAHRGLGRRARIGFANWFPGEFEVIPNGVLIPEHAEPGGREHRIVFVGRHDPRKGMPVLLRAWPEIHRRTGARLRIVGADPLMVRLALSRDRRRLGGDRLARLPQPGRPDGGAREREGPRRAIARRRELRHGADAGLRLRDPGRVLRHQRLP